MSEPTTKPKRRWLPRWSMRAMFLGVTVFCVVLAVVVRRAEEQKKAVAALEAVQGVEIYYDYQWRFYFDSDPPFLEKLAPPGPDWLRELIGIDYFDDVVGVRVPIISNIRDDDLRQLRHFGKLETLYLFSCRGITDVGMDQLTGLTSISDLILSDIQFTTLPSEIGKLTKLKSLDLGGNQLTRLPPEIGQLTNLTKLEFYGNPITDADLEHLKSLRGLQRLNLYDTKVTAEGVADLQRALPNCKIESDFDFLAPQIRPPKPSDSPSRD